MFNPAAEAGGASELLVWTSHQWKGIEVQMSYSRAGEFLYMGYK